MFTCYWLPELMSYKDYPNIDVFDDAVYKVFKRDFIDSSPNFNGMIVKKKHIFI